MKIFLIGNKSSGKSTLGRQLAAHLGLQFVDTDEYIEANEKSTIPQIYTNIGELEFRKKESIAITEIINKDNVIVSTGGGTPAFHDNMNLMNAAGITIYLKVSIDELAKRILTSSMHRPIVKGKNKEELIQFIQSTLQQREPFYNRAHIKIEGDRISVDDIQNALKYRGII